MSSTSFTLAEAGKALFIIAIEQYAPCPAPWHTGYRAGAYACIIWDRNGYPRYVSILIPSCDSLSTTAAITFLKIVANETEQNFT